MIYLNTAGTAKISAKSVEIAKQYLDEMVESGSLAAVKWRAELDLPLRKLIAQLTGAKLHQVALVPNTSFGLTSIAQRLVGERKRVMTIEGDYPSITLPWTLLDFECNTFLVKDGIIDAQALIKAIELNKSEIVVLSHVMWHTGFRVDLEVICAYCKANDIISIVDVTQSLGTIPIDFQTTGADVLLCSTYKWLSAGFGLGLMAMSDSFFKRYPPKIGGYASFQDVNGEWIYQHSMKSYQPGSLSITSMAILKNSIEEINAISVEVIHERSIKRAAQLVQLLEKHPVKLLGAPRGSSLSNIVCIETVDGLFHHLEKNEVIIVERNKHIRMSVTHLTTDGELKELDAILSRFFTA